MRLRPCHCRFDCAGIALALPDDATLSRLLSERGRVHDTRLNTALTGRGSSIRPMKAITRRGRWRIEHGRLIETWRFTDEAVGFDVCRRNRRATEKIFKSRIILQEGPGKPEGQVLPSEIFTVTRGVPEKNRRHSDPTAVQSDSSSDHESGATHEVGKPLEECGRSNSRDRIVGRFDSRGGCRHLSLGCALSRRHFQN